MKRVLITGITGTMGQELSRKLLRDPSIQITGISRDEQKQKQLPGHPRLRLRIADVRDGPGVARTCNNIDRIYHMAALKCVDVLEYHPQEAFQTNVIGTQNMLDLANAYNAELVFASTDKACYPVNVYGQTKALAEKMVLNAGQTVARYGNVLGSRGSFLPNLILSLKTEAKAFVTDPAMTRFWMSAGQTSDFILTCEGGGVKIPHAIQASSIHAFVDAVAAFCGVERFETVLSGIRPGEKIHETLQTAEEHTHIQSCDKERQFHPESLKRFIIDVMKGEA